MYGVRLAGGEMGEDSLDEVGGLDARDDAQCPTTKRTVLDIEMEDSFEPLHVDGCVKARVFGEQPS